ncbi:MAG TPA: cupin domain-containing protein [Candidatus Dormibacteraeota bacterium]|nr:cupin domain-containing protein [Candidatus Dormibacteraeota bacterium]
MAQNGQVIENPTSGERIVIRQTARETGGRLLAFDLFLGPGGRVPSGHAHPAQEEAFTVLEGRMRFRRGFRVIRAGPEERVVMPPGVFHSFANRGPDPAHVLVEVRPAMRMEEVLEMAAQLGRPAASTGPFGVRRLTTMALFLREYRREIGPPGVPPWVVAAVTAPLAALAGGLGQIQRRRAGTVTPR